MFTIGPAWRGNSAVDPFSKLLCHFDGADGSTTTTDEFGNALTLGTNLVLSTAEKRFGSAALFNSTGSSSSGGCVITPAAGIQPGANDFTIECWVRSTFHPTDAYLFYFERSAPNHRVLVAFTGFPTIVFQVGLTITSYSEFSYPTSAWVHFALCRNGNEARLFMNGVQKGSTLSSLPTLDDFAFMTIGKSIGAGGSNFAWPGRIDEFRLSIGVCRYWSGFTPPAAPFTPP